MSKVQLLESHLKGSPESGEYLISQSFEADSTKLFMGTEDEEKLELRSIVNDWVPHRLQDQLTADNIRYLDQGFEVKLS